MCRYEYLWQDEVRHKKAVQMTAPEYILTLLEWASDIITVDCRSHAEVETGF